MEQLTLLWQESHANQQVVPGSAEAQKMTVGSGEKLLELLKLPSQGGVFSRTLLEYLVYKGGFHSRTSLLRWKLKATKFNRLLFQLAPSMPRTEGKESLSWRTPQSHNGNQGPKSKEFCERCLQTNESMITLTDQVRHNPGMWPTPLSNCHTGAGTQGRQGGENLQTAVTWPTPKATDYKGSGPHGSRSHQHDVAKRNLKGSVMENGNTGQLNPAWVECLQGFPQGWTSLDGLPDQAHSNTNGSRRESQRASKTGESG